MTRTEFYDVVKLLNVLYEKDGKFMFESPDKITAWYSCLNDLEYQPCCEAIRQVALTNKYRPTIADIREQYVKIVNNKDMISEMEAWNMVRLALRDSTYHSEEQFEEFPEFVKRIVVSPARLKEWGQLPSDTVSSVVRAEFRHSYESAYKQFTEAQIIGDERLWIAEKVARQLTMTRTEIQKCGEMCKEGQNVGLDVGKQG